MNSTNKTLISTPGISPVFSVSGIPTTLAISRGGILDVLSYAWCWGNNPQGQLGDNTQINRSSPVSVVGGKQWRLINMGTFVTTALDSNSYAWGWGNNTNGAVGDNTGGPGVVRLSPVSVVGGRQWLTVVTGAIHNIALDSLSYAWGWGKNDNGTVGDNTAQDRSSPVSVAGGKQWIFIAAGAGHTLALDTLSYAWAWGDNNTGHIGDNTSGNRRSSPVSVVGGKQWIMLAGGGGNASGGHHSAGLDNLSYAWCWGINTNGQLGDNAQTQQNSPVSVVGGKQFVYIAAAKTCTVAIDGSGFLWAWGANNSGQLGDNTVTQRLSPVSVIGLGATQIKKVAGQFGDTGVTNTSCAIIAWDTYNNPWVWGTNANGDLGLINNLANRSSPTFNPLRGPTNIANPLGKV